MVDGTCQRNGNIRKMKVKMERDVCLISKDISLFLEKCLLSFSCRSLALFVQEMCKFIIEFIRLTCGLHKFNGKFAKEIDKTRDVKENDTKHISIFGEMLVFVFLNIIKQVKYMASLTLILTCFHGAAFSRRSTWKPRQFCCCYSKTYSCNN